VDEYLNNKHKETLLGILANPANVGQAYADDLHSMVKAYPQSGLIQALYARASAQSSPTQASASFNNAVLHKLYYHPDSLATVADVQIIVLTHEATVVEPEIYNQPDAGPETQPAELPDFLNISWPDSQPENAEVSVDEQKQEEQTSDETDNVISETVTLQEQQTDVPVSDEQYSTEEVYEVESEAAADSTIPSENVITPQQSESTDTVEERAPWETDEDREEVEDIQSAQNITDTEPVIDEEPQPDPTDYIQERVPWETDEQEPVQEEPGTWDLIADEYSNLSTETHPVPVNSNVQTDIEEEVYEEITGIDDIEIAQHPAGVSSDLVANDEDVVEQQGTGTEQTDDAEKLILGNIAATDYFVFDRAFNDKKADNEAVAEGSQQQFIAEAQNNTQAGEHHDVSKYYDEKMPYTFMWWLDKTRREHGELYQPYSNNPVSSPVKKPVDDELQQQYFENIFHLAPVDKLGSDDSSKTIEFNMQRKEDRIIQRFITEDPHIHPPVGEKLDTENKAKKSSEDSNDIVTETLARIYAEQMLYPKAIATYKKLMLKYPEKSRYFASRIENLEKRKN